jgi:leucyl/phenylalanyl-tRNA--protein transferase
MDLFEVIESEDFYFPHPETADKEGLLAFGGDLSAGRILQAYRQGIFPWYQPGNPILWWSPNPRLILKPCEFKISRSFKKTLNQAWQCSNNSDFAGVIKACATTGGRVSETWITSEMMDAYCTLHRMGYAHSIEIRQNNELVGGLYGICLGRAFFGESMFHTVTDASKIALYYLCNMLKKAEFHFIDCQLPTSHLQRLGAKIISRKAFLHELELALAYENQTKIFNKVNNIPI